MPIARMLEAAAKALLRRELKSKSRKRERGYDSGAKSPRGGRGASALRLDGDDLAVLPDVDGRTVHPGDLARALGRAAEGTADSAGEFVVLWSAGLSFHGPRSSNRGRAPELSYTDQRSASGR